MVQERNALLKGSIVADAGASKIDWAIGEEGGVRYARTGGFNPFFHDEADIEAFLKEEKELVVRDPSTVRRIHFYGAGCSGPMRIERVRKGLVRIFPEADIEVEHDLLGAARAAAGNEAGSVAILGTGSNTCSYDGERIIEQSGGLGYILGDEGSGAHLGKLLLGAYLNGELPESVKEAFCERFPQSREELIDTLHRNEAPSRYLAGFAPFVKEWLKEEAVEAMVRSAFEELFSRHLLRFGNVKAVPLHTVGSIGHHFRPVLETLAQRYEIRLGRSVIEPIRELAMYHAAS